MLPKPPRANVNDLYVDHLTTNLEKLSIAKILDFLASYCGWEEIFEYVYKKVEEKRKNAQHSVYSDAGDSVA